MWLVDRPRVEALNGQVRRHNRLFILAAVAGGAVALALSAGASAQIFPTPFPTAPQATYPPPTSTPTPPPTSTPSPPPTSTPTPQPTSTPRPSPSPQPQQRCAQTGRVVDGKFHGSSRFHRGDPIAVRGQRKCAADNAAVGVVLDPPNGRPIGNGFADDRGAYLIQGQLPQKLSAGDHTVRVNTGRRHYDATITIVTKSKAAAFVTSPAGPGALLLVLGALALAIVLPRRRRLATASAHPSSEIPRIDTSGFVPFVDKGKGRRRPAPEGKGRRRREA